MYVYKHLSTPCREYAFVELHLPFTYVWHQLWTCAALRLMPRFTPAHMQGLQNHLPNPCGPSGCCELMEGLSASQGLLPSWSAAPRPPGSNTLLPSLSCAISMAAMPTCLLVLRVGRHELESRMLPPFTVQCSGMVATRPAMLLPASPEMVEVDGCLDRGTGVPPACRLGNTEAGRSGPSADLVTS